MTVKGFERCTPESAGLPSAAILRFLDRLDEHGLRMHSVLMLRGGRLVCEGYYAPFTGEDKHRMYSVSKSFTSMAIGLLAAEKRLSLDDPVVRFFPEYDTPELHPYLRGTTIRHLLMMADCHSGQTYNGAVDRDWVDTWFRTPPAYPSGTIYAYNTACTVLLCVIAERLTGKSFLEFLKERALLETGFSPDADCVETPCGHAWGGSGVLCTAMDLMRFAYLCMKGGNWFGRQLLPESYVREATSKQIDNYMDDFDDEHQQGYGYQFWRIKHGGFGCLGMGSQFAFCLPEKDFILVTTGDNQAINPAANLEILHGLWEDLYPCLSDGPLPEDAEGAKALQEKLASLKLFSLRGAADAPARSLVSGKTYALDENPMGMRRIRFDFLEGEGVMRYQNATGEHSLRFGINGNREQEFPETHYSGRRIGTPYGRGYRCFTSAKWIGRADLLLECQLADMYFGSFKLQASFRGETIALRLWKVAEWFLDEYQGWAAGHSIS